MNNKITQVSWICSHSSSGLDENGTRDDNIETQSDANHNDDDDDEEEKDDEEKQVGRAEA